MTTEAPPATGAASAGAADAVHPMVPVPDALRTVLRETAKSIIQKSSSSPSSVTTKTVHLHAADGTPQYSQVLGKILAQDVMVADPYPPFDASIMDGYAVKSADLASSAASDGEWTHRIAGQIYAGDDTDGDGKQTKYDEKSGSLPTAAYVTTGAVVPAPYDAVVPIEDIALSPDGQYLRIDADPSKTQPGKWIRGVGCDIAQGDVALSAGTVLQPPHIGILIQVGVHELVVRSVPTVGVLSTGNEILPSHQHPSASGKIPDVNRPVLLSTLASWGNCTPVDLGIETDDDIQQLIATLASAIDKCDVVCTTGGISMGEKDIMEDVFVGTLGASVHFGRIHMKPGKPTTFMTIKMPQKQKTCLVFCLPGNPVSGIVCSHLFVRPCLDMLVRGIDANASLDDTINNATVQEEITAQLTKDVKLDVERPEYRRVRLTYQAKAGGAGKFLASSTGVQRSSRLMSMNGADGLMLLPKGEPGGKLAAKAGEMYPVMLLGGAIGSAGVKVRDSIHMNGLPSGEFKAKVSPVLISNVDDDSARNIDLDRISGSIYGVLGSKHFCPHQGVSASTKIVASGGIDGILKNPDLKDADVVLLVCSGTSFQDNLTYASELRSIMDKPADAMALQARKGSAEAHPTSALFEFAAFDGPEFMVILLPDDGLEGALNKIKGLLSHGVKVAKRLPSHKHDH